MKMNRYMELRFCLDKIISNSVGIVTLTNVTPLAFVLEHSTEHLEYLAE